MVSATTDAIQAATGVAALVVSVLALRETRLLRVKDASSKSTGAAVSPAPRPKAPEPPSPASTAAEPRDTQRLPALTQPATSWPTTQWVVARAVLVGAIYGFLFDALHDWPLLQLTLSFGVLAIAIGLFVSLRFAPLERTKKTKLLGIVGGLLGAPVASIFTAFTTRKQSLPTQWDIVSAVALLVVLVVWFLVDKRRADRQQPPH
ncbi:hypothetical protein [Streptomyces sp. WAC01526]|uniref:hypothetical protein n=1 Tax=Streptomyces sp. WAC01526 TaxID=2588709 RepID=UPI0011DFC419|nr:hypothetical protein [Streptomyces sp. WAC01526]